VPEFLSTVASHFLEKLLVSCIGFLHRDSSSEESSSDDSDEPPVITPHKPQQVKYPPKPPPVPKKQPESSSDDSSSEEEAPTGNKCELIFSFSILIVSGKRTESSVLML
jgi:hypothetical protein